MRFQIILTNTRGVCLNHMQAGFCSQEGSKRAAVRQHPFVLCPSEPSASTSTGAGGGSRSGCAKGRVRNRSLESRRIQHHEVLSAQCLTQGCCLTPFVAVCLPKCSCAASARQLRLHLRLLWSFWKRRLLCLTELQMKRDEGRYSSKQRRAVSHEPEVPDKQAAGSRLVT